ncbi:D-xylose 1-dehydrogenase Gfo6 [Halalkalicoccus jeotgali]|uniref:Xylose dehydrogenase n=1 Tax=Halalkalicoccus jeotgali (strain DSM 18796 / CECT 7217 / JCM 14584 / KCTC 4019 / B3) TaxID=795797 RepID=D8JA25_HALJB|nr:D-xylose 1-dehydrogenase Gfo6 [Halalkalicoccus jeotgali]ADJ14547.1 xylose dehydrogenase [Halalkalicoccus jeotgali B3]ELY39920.1 xylose dehydrogenase [Halalkalicoccus jeotgali B3]
MSLEEFLGGFTERDWQHREEGTVRLAMVGMGWWTREEAIPAIEGSDFCETTVAVSGSISDPREVEGTDLEYAIDYEAFADGEASGAYDAVYVATPNALHLEHVRSAAKLGKDVICEKPMEVSAERARELTAVCERAGVTLMIAYRVQTDPATRRARDLLREGVIGEPVSVHGGMTDDMLSFVDGPDHWRLDPDLSGGTTMNDIGIYPLNTTRFLLDRDPISASGRTWSESPEFEGVDEHASFEFGFEDGIVLTGSVSHSACEESHLRVVGTEGQLLLDRPFFPGRSRELLVEREGTRSTVTFDQRDQMREEFDYFAHCLLTDTEPAPDGEHGVLDIRAIEAVYEAAETGKRVEL